ncbi:MAG TPA: hypothetical protein VKS79_12060 [Gemmataceae bacterium]|nr:hypothetical protein [Gemmataceae bacterium]
MPAMKGMAMDKKMCIGALAVAGLMLVIFLLDCIASVPFGLGVSVINIFGIIASGIVGYLAFHALRELR